VDDRRLDYYAVGVLLPSLPKAIGSFHRTHNPTADLIGPHLTLVYPVPASTGRDAFLGHVRGVVSGTPPFDIRLRGLEKSWDHFLFLLVTEGREEVVALHDGLYTEILRPHLWTDRPYVPHVTLGLFAKERDAHDLLELRPRSLDRTRFEEALREAEAMDLDHRCRVDAVHIFGLDEELTHITPLEELPLGAN
jgi:2'-5' RNA ligase